ncbi:MAG: DUF5398 family protein [Chlamydiales bacterium]|nr:DUF5398 family protein [Chlamydiales bacterium]
MFGLEQKKAGPAFDLESKLKGPNAAVELAELKKVISSRIEELKSLLRKGEDKKVFDETEALLLGYTAVEQVIAKISKK